MAQASNKLNTRNCSARNSAPPKCLVKAAAVVVARIGSARLNEKPFGNALRMELAATGDSHRELRLHVAGVNAMREAIFTSRHAPGKTRATCTAG